MSDHPTTYRGEDDHEEGIAWEDRAFLHHTGDGDGVLDGAKALRSGTFAELIRQVMTLPESSRGDYYIEKAGDREFHAGEIARLAQRPDFPAS